MKFKNYVNVNKDGSFSTTLSDGYDFGHMDKSNNYKHDKIIAPINNTAFSQQEKEKIKKYLLSAEINLTPEEIEEILKKYR